MGKQEEALNAIGQYIEIDGFCFPVSVSLIWENTLTISDPRASGKWGDSAEKEFPVLKMSLSDEDERRLFPARSAPDFFRLRGDPETGKWVSKEAMRARIEALIAGWEHSRLIDLCKPMLPPAPNRAEHHKWDWEPGYGPSY